MKVLLILLNKTLDPLKLHPLPVPQLPPPNSGRRKTTAIRTIPSYYRDNVLYT